MKSKMAAASSSDNALLLDAALENIPYGFCVWSDDFRLVLWNKHYRDIYGFPRNRIRKGMTLDAAARLARQLGHHGGDDGTAFIDSYKAELLDNRGGERVKSRERLAGGRTIETAHVHSPGLGWVVTHEDVTAEIAAAERERRRKRELERQNLRLDAAVNNISQGLCMFDPRGRLVICNAPYARIYDLPPHLVKPGTKLEDILAHLFALGMSAGENRDAYIKWRREVIARGEYGKNLHEFGGRLIMMQHHPMDDGGWVTTHEDITEQRAQEERLQHLARHDALTELPNRSQFLEQMAAAEPALERGEKAAVLYIDLDDFKAVNEAHGYAMGDKVLKQASARLWGTTRETDVLARLGGDEFSLLLRPVHKPAEAAAIAERIVGTMEAPFRIDGHQIGIGAGVGIAMAPADGESTDRLMKNAHLALHRAKREGRSRYRFFEPGMDAAIQQRRELEAGLRQALARNELRLEYQPLLGLREDRVSCLEALLRWDHPEHGAISPADFIPVAEETGLIEPIGEWVLREACRTASGWPAHVRVAVNLSPVQFRNRRLYETVQAALVRGGLAPARLELEITESLLLAENEPTLDTLHRLRALGVRISMDDFGIGYSSLSYLRSFPFDKIKIDRSFMRDIDGGDSLAIVRAVIELGRSLGMATTAEGVETEAQLAAVREQGCDEAQGFHLWPPLKPAAVEALFAGEARPKLLRVS